MTAKLRLDGVCTVTIQRHGRYITAEISSSGQVGAVDDRGKLVRLTAEETREIGELAKDVRADETGR